MEHNPVIEQQRQAERNFWECISNETKHSNHQRKDSSDICNYLGIERAL